MSERRPAPEAALDQLVGSVKVTTKIMWQQDNADHHAPYEISHHHLQEGEVGVIGKPGNADDGERAGFGGNDGERDRPPRDVSSRKKVITQRTVAFAEAQTEQRDPHQIESDDREIEFVETHSL